MQEPEEIQTQTEEFLQSILDAFPAAVYVVDEDVRIISSNRAGLELAAASPSRVHHRRAGDALHCIRAVNSRDGCGTTEYCQECVVRGSVAAAFKGARTVRERYRFEVVTGDHSREIYFLVTATPFRHGDQRFALLVLEDISELVQLKKAIPICMNCKKIRNDQEYWDNIDSYLEKHLDLTFSHDLCPECLKELYPEFGSEQKK